MAQGSTKKNPRNTNPPPFQFNWGAPFGGFGPATWGQSFAPAYGYGAGGYVPFTGYGNQPRPTGYNPYAGYVTTPSLGNAPLGVTPPEAPAPLNDAAWGKWGPTHQDWWNGMLNDAWGYGLTYDQTQEGYVPGPSERNAFGQPLGTPGPLRVTGPRSPTQSISQSKHPNREPITKRTGWKRDGGDSHWRPGGPKRPKPKPKKGMGVSPAWVNGLAQLNVP